MCFAMITIQDVEDAQEKWGQGIVEISSVYDEGGDFVKEPNYTLIHFMITKMVAFYSSLHLQAKCNFVQHSNQPFLTLSVKTVYALKIQVLQSKAGLM